MVQPNIVAHDFIAGGTESRLDTVQHLGRSIANTHDLRIGIVANRLSNEASRISEVDEPSFGGQTRNGASLLNGNPYST